MKLIITILSTPVVLAVELYCLSFIGELISQKSDMAVLIGALSFSAFLIANALFVKYIIKVNKTPKTK